MTNRRTIDHTALAARWQREAEDWSDPDDEVTNTAIVHRPPTFVSPEPRKSPVHVEVLPPATMPEAPSVQALSRAQTVVTGSHQDRARAFSHVTGRLALAMGILSVIVGVVGFGVPVLSLAVLAWFGSAYTAVWFAAFVINAFVSAEGAAWLHVWSAWRWLGREQQHRHYIERRRNFPEDYRR